MSAASKSPVGCWGVVAKTGAIPPSGLGEVLVDMGDAGTQAFFARDADKRGIEPDVRIVVIDRISTRLVLVARVDPEWAPEQDVLTTPGVPEAVTAAFSDFERWKLSI